jgi:hypothetical protein
MRRLAVLFGLVCVALALSATSAAAAEPPALGSLSISPSSVDVSSSAKTVTVSAQITSPVGVSGASVAFESPRGNQSTARASFSKVSGTATNGVWEASVLVKQYSATGTWKVSTVNLTDTEGNQVRLSSTQLEAKGFPHTVTVTGTEDNEPPQLTGLAISPPSVNVASGPQSVTVTAHITDNLSGVASASIGFRSPAGKITTGHSTFIRVSGTATNGTYEATVTFPHDGQAGPWVISTLTLADNVGNEAVLSPKRVEAKGFPASVPVGSVEDTTPPGVSSLSITPSVNTTSSPQTVTVTGQLTDNLSGVVEATIAFQSPSGKQLTQRVAFAKTSGSETNGSWEAKVPFEQFIQNGTWKVSSLNLIDNAGNEVRLTAAQLEAKSLPASVTVTSNEDTAAPVLATFSISPASVNTTSGSQTVTLTAEITDNASGFAQGNVIFISPSGAKVNTSASFVKVSGTGTKGIYEAQATFTPYVASGTWKVHNVKLVDAVGNEANISTTQLEEKGFAHSVAVTSTEDVEPPVLTALSMSPRNINTAANEQLVVLNAQVTDNLSGVAGGSVLFVSPTGKHQTEAAKFFRTSGTETSGSWEAVVQFKAASESGTWKVGSVTLEDVAENAASYSAAQLESKGFPATVTNETGAPPTVKKVRPKKGPAEGGTTVTIIGIDFVHVLGVKFGNTEANSFSVNSPGSITAVSPAGASGTVDITVTSANGASATSSHDHFKYGAPTVTRLSPESGPVAGGTTVTITGSGFLPGSGTSFSFGKLAASSVSCSSTTTCTAVSPAASKPSSVIVSATVNSKRSKTKPKFTYT